MKKLILIITVIVLIFALCACDNTKEEVDYDSTNAYIIDIEEDNYGNIISKTVYNKITEQTYLYTYTYQYHNGFWECTNVNVVIVLRGGTVVYPED